MYQKHEITLKKDTTNGKLSIEIQKFYEEVIKFYIDELNRLSAYKDDDGEPIVKVTVATEETDDAVFYKIEELWGFDRVLWSQQRYTLPDEVVDQLYDLDYDVNFVIDEFKKRNLGDAVECFMIRRLVDDIGNGEGAIGYFEKSTQIYTQCAYTESANMGHCGKSLVGEIVDEEFLLRNPDKIWHSTSPMIVGFLIAAEGIDAKIAEIGYGFNVYYDCEFCNSEAIEFTDYDESYFANITSPKLLNMVKGIVEAFNLMDVWNKKICESTGEKFEECGCIKILLHSDDNEILYVTSEPVDAGKVTFIYKKLN